MKEITLDCRDIKTIEELHAAIAKAFDFPDYYGRNLDALYDCLSSDVELPVKFTLKHSADLKKKLKKDAEKVIKVFSGYAAEEKDFVFKAE